MKEEEKRVVSRVLSLHNPSFLLPHICSQRLLSCLLFVLGYGWKCLDFDKIKHFSFIYLTPTLSR